LKIKKVFMSCALAASALGAAAAMAVPASTAGGLGNDFTSVTKFGAWGNPVVEGLYGDHISVAALGGGSWAKFHVEVFGGEAGYTNSFTFGSQTYTHTGGNDLKSTPVKEWDVVSLGGGLLDFKFKVLQNGGVFTNGANPLNVGSAANFFTSFGVDDSLRAPDLLLDGGTLAAGKYVWLFLDDGGGKPSDNDYDDLIVRITYVPEPATLGLLGLGLIGVGALRRRKTG